MQVRTTANGKEPERPVIYIVRLRSGGEGERMLENKTRLGAWSHQPVVLFARALPYRRCAVSSQDLFLRREE
jgi:hypothetical protein